MIGLRYQKVISEVIAFCFAIFRPRLVDDKSKIEAILQGLQGQIRH